MNIEGIFPIGKMAKIKGDKKRCEKLDNILHFGEYGEKQMSKNIVVGRGAS